MKGLLPLLIFLICSTALLAQPSSKSKSIENKANISTHSANVQKAENVCIGGKQTIINNIRQEIIDTTNNLNQFPNIDLWYSDKPNPCIVEKDSNKKLEMTYTVYNEAVATELGETIVGIYFSKNSMFLDTKFDGTFLNPSHKLHKSLTWTTIININEKHKKADTIFVYHRLSYSNFSKTHHDTVRKIYLLTSCSPIGKSIPEANKIQYKIISDFLKESNDW